MLSKPFSRPFGAALIAALPLSFVSASVQADARPGDLISDPINEGIVVTASKAAALDIGGSVQLLEQEDMARFAYSDANRLLRQVPGVNIQEEDGFGLRPNIGIRGSGSDRSARVALMEDGALIAPAPYAAPAAYYFPHVGRIATMEVSKGPAAIKYGPMTVGGAINLGSTPIPGEPSGFAEALAGSHDGRRAHGWAGGWARLTDALEIGGLIEGLYEHSGGFKRIDSGGDTGFEVTDLLAKLALRTTDGRHAFEFKFQDYDEQSAETYLGLTLDDFLATPFRRYNGSQVDAMNVSHRTYQLSHRFRPSDAITLTTIAYRHDTARAWYKLNDVRNNAGTGWIGISTVLANPAGNSLQMADLIGVPGYSSRSGALRVRNNNRVYQASGIQSVLELRFGTGALRHDLELSARYHEDREDRFQQDDLYQMVDGRMHLTSAGAPGSQDNRVSAARAWAFYVRDTIEAGTLTLVPGMRFESIDLRQTRWSTADPLRSGATTVAESHLNVWIPGISATWEFLPDMRLVAGAHRGFASPAPGSTARAERSWNYEAGFKLGNGRWHAELIGYFNDYSNLVGTCTGSTGGGCTIGDQFDAGGVHVKGVEMTAGHTFGNLADNGFEVPLSFSYTLTDAHFQTSFASSYEPWGTVQAGDALPYLPRHQLTLNAGLAFTRARLSATLNLVSTARARAGTGPVAPNARIDRRALVDLSAEVDVLGSVALFASVNNLFNTHYNVAFAPAGARPGAPRMAQAGLRARF